MRSLATTSTTHLQTQALRMHRRTLLRHLTLAVAATLLAGCSELTMSGDPLEAHLAQWRSQNLDDYRFDFQRTCFCTPASVQPVTIEVRDGKVARVFSRPSGQDVPSTGMVSAWPTVDDLFTQVGQASAARVAPLVVRWDEQRGYPTYVEMGTLANDAGTIMAASNLTPL
jgi:hypothetical protein